MLSQAKRRTTIYRCISGVVMESLEGRLLLSTTTAPTTSADLPDPIVPIKLPEAPLPLQGIVGTPESLSPAMLNTTYGFGEIAYNVGGTDSGGTLIGGTDYQGNGAGTTIAIVDAYGSPTITSDLETFDAHWGISNNDAEGNFCLTIQPLGGVNVSPGPVTSNADWATETSLDVEWAHAVAPGAHILLVESPDPSLIHMFDAVVYAAEQPGVVDVSMSWGSDVNATDFPNDQPWIYDGYFVTPDGHLDSNGVAGGVTFLASSGDDGDLSYPAASFNVVSVGGMTVSVGLDGTFQDEAPWNNTYGSSGGGEDSIYASEYNTPFVSLEADPVTGVWMYDSTPDDGVAGWQVVGGTSLACPVWAGYVAIIDQGVMLSGRGSLQSDTVIDDIITAGEQSPAYFIGSYGGQAPMYPLGMAPYPDFQAIPSNGNTGFGVPNALYFDTTNDLVANPFASYILEHDPGATPTIAFQSSSIPQLAFVQGPSSTVAGQTISPAITVDETGGTLTGTVSIAISLLSPSGNADLLGTTTVTAVNGVATFSNLAIDQAGTYELQAAETGVLAGISGQFTVSAAAPVDLGFITQPSATWQFGPVTPPVVVGMEDQFGNVVTTSTNPVSIVIESGPAGAALSGSTTVNASAGRATFDDLVFSKSGQYTILATSAGLTGATSNSFTVVGIPATERFLFNGAAIGPVLILQQEHRNATLIAAQGSPSSAQIAAVPAAVPAVPAVIASGADASANATPAAADSPGPLFSFIPVSSSSSDDDLNQLLAGD